MRSNESVLDKSSLHSSTVKHSCGINKKNKHFSPSTNIYLGTLEMHHFIFTVSSTWLI